jgi:hypothetical protein
LDQRIVDQLGDPAIGNVDTNAGRADIATGGRTTVAADEHCAALDRGRERPAVDVVAGVGAAEQRSFDIEARRVADIKRVCAMYSQILSHFVMLLWG